MSLKDILENKNKNDNDIYQGITIIRKDSLQPIADKIMEDDIYEKLCKIIYAGLSDVHIAQMLGVSLTTLRNNTFCMHTIEQIRKEYTTVKIAEAEQALERKMKGYTVTETTKEVRRQRGKVYMEIETTTEKYIAPSDQLIQYYLANRDPKRWQAASKVVPVEDSRTQGILANIDALLQHSKERNAELEKQRELEDIEEAETEEI